LVRQNEQGEVGKGLEALTCPRSISRVEDSHENAGARSPVRCGGVLTPFCAGGIFGLVSTRNRAPGKHAANGSVVPNPSFLRLVCAFLALLAQLPILSSAAPVSNCQVHLPKGYTAVGNNYWSGHNSLDEVLPAVLPDTRLYKFNPKDGEYEEYIFDGYGWQGGSSSGFLMPGEGAWILSPSPQVISFSGQSEALWSEPRDVGGTYFVGGRNPNPATFEEMMGFPPVPGDKVFAYASPVAIPPLDYGPPTPGEGASIHTYGSGGWDFEPILQPCQAAFVDLANPDGEVYPSTNWVVWAGAVALVDVAAEYFQGNTNQAVYALDPGAPDAAILDPATGLFIWETSPGEGGSYPVTVRVSDPYSGASPGAVSFTIVVLPDFIMSELDKYGSFVEISWRSIPGFTYHVSYKDSLGGAHWQPLPGDVTATGYTASKIDESIPGAERYYLVTVADIPSWFTYCLVDEAVHPGPGVTASVIAPESGEIVVDELGSTPLIVTGSDLDQLKHTCKCFLVCTKEQIIPIADSVLYDWKKVAGEGQLRGAVGPSTLFDPPSLQIGQTKSVTLQVEVWGSRNNEKKARITYTLEFFREKECGYKRTVSAQVDTYPGSPLAATSGSCTCAPVAPAWQAVPLALSGSADGPVEVCAGERVIFHAEGADLDLLELICSGECGFDSKKTTVLDEKSYSWSAARGAFPDHSGSAETLGRISTAIYKAPDTAGDDTIKVIIRNRGIQADDPPVIEQLEIKVREVDLRIHKPKVIDPAETMIPEDEELCKGAQTFVNLDNDDNDGKFDTGTTDSEVPGEDEMVKVILRVGGADASGEAKLSAVAGADKVKVWTDASKKTEYPLGAALSVPGDFTPSGGALVKELWVEGIKPHTKQRETRLTLTFTSGDMQCEDEVALTILGIDKIEWVGRNNSRTHSNTLDLDVLTWPAGLRPNAVRVFPGARVSGGALEAGDRDEVDVKVALTVKPVEAVSIYFDSFDVDDPTFASNPVDNEANERDNLGAAPHRDGRFDGETGGLKEQSFDEKEETFGFQVTMQPGDNFRVVGSGDKDYLAELENRDAVQDVGANTAERNVNKLRIVNKQVTGTPEAREVRSSASYVSNVLLVWRFLHTELDSYAAPGAGVVFDGACVGNADVNPGDLGNSDTTLMVAEYRRAFVEAVDDLGTLDATDDATFVRNLSDAAAAAKGNAMRDQASLDRFWVVQVVSAYEGESIEDFDGEGTATWGFAPGADGPCLIYHETIRDTSASCAGVPNWAGTVAAGVLEQRIVLHESLHRFAMSHDGGAHDTGPLSANTNRSGTAAQNQINAPQIDNIRDQQRPR